MKAYSKNSQMSCVGFLGSAGSYSDLALTRLFAKRNAGQVRRKGFHSLSLAVDALEAGHLDYVLLPMENTIAGSLNETYQMLGERQLSIVDEEILTVEHCLVGLPGTDIHNLNVIRSHPIALQQCSRWLSNLPACVQEGHTSTVASAESVLSGADLQVAAIASEDAANRLKLKVLERNIANQAHNFTRFVLVAQNAEEIEKTIPARISMILSVNHRQGSLARCLVALAQRKINLTKLESRVNPESPWEYYFYLDIEGHSEDALVKEALEEVAAHANSIKILGCYTRRDQ